MPGCRLLAVTALLPEPRASNLAALEIGRHDVRVSSLQQAPEHPDRS